MVALKAPGELHEKVYDLCPTAAVDVFRIECLYTTYSSDVNQLHWLVLEKSPDAAKVICPRDQCLPLHDVCSNCTASMEVINYVCEAYPDGITKKDKWGSTPLRIAFCNSSLCVVDYVVGTIDKKAKLLYKGNDCGGTPLYFAFLRGADCSEEENKAVRLFVVKRYG
jgi:hypothetical protein